MNVLTSEKIRQRIAIIEDDTYCRFVYEDILSERYDIVFYESLSDFKKVNWQDFCAQYDLFIVDLFLSDGSFVDYLSNSGDLKDLAKMPFIIVSVNDEVEMLRLCFEYGAIDYLTKPFNKNQLLIKIEHFFSQKAEHQQTQPNQEFKLDHYHMTLSSGDRQFQNLTPKEFNILSLLLDAPSRRLTRENIYESLWNSSKVSAKTIDVHLSNLRRKIQTSGLTIRFEQPYFVLGKSP
jgi:DNA-binding response OmpR family regulator